MKDILVLQIVVMLGAASLMGQNPPPSPEWRLWIDRGKDAFRHAKYPEAIAAFQKASQANPQNATPHIYLGFANYIKYSPGAISTANAQHAHSAEAELRTALALDPASWIATILLAQLVSGRNRMEEARELYRKALTHDPRNAYPWYALGVVAYREWLAQNKRQPALLNDAISHFEKFVALDPLNENAMQYLSLLLRERAQTKDREDDRRADLAASEQWLEKSSNARSEKVQASIAGVVSQTDSRDPDAFLKQWITVTVPPPPPPPPPPPLSARALQGGPSVIVFEPMPRNAAEPPPIRVPSAIQARKLITKVDAAYTAPIPAESRVRFVVVIGKDGRIVREIQVGGIPWLQQASVEALRRWVYQPTLVNGNPVEVVTEVQLNFKPGQ